MSLSAACLCHLFTASCHGRCRLMTARPLYFRAADRRPHAAPSQEPKESPDRRGRHGTLLSHFCLDLALLWRICRGLAVVSYFAVMATARVPPDREN